MMEGLLLLKNDVVFKVFSSLLVDTYPGIVLCC